MTEMRSRKCGGCVPNQFQCAKPVNAFCEFQGFIASRMPGNLLVLQGLGDDLQKSRAGIVISLIEPSVEFNKYKRVLVGQQAFGRALVQHEFIANQFDERGLSKTPGSRDANRNGLGLDLSDHRGCGLRDAAEVKKIYICFVVSPHTTPSKAEKSTDSGRTISFSMEEEAASCSESLMGCASDCGVAFHYCQPAPAVLRQGPRLLKRCASVQSFGEISFESQLSFHQKITKTCTATKSSTVL